MKNIYCARWGQGCIYRAMKKAKTVLRFIKPKYMLQDANDRSCRGYARTLREAEDKQLDYAAYDTPVWIVDLRGKGVGKTPRMISGAESGERPHTACEVSM